MFVLQEFEGFLGLVHGNVGQGGHHGGGEVGAAVVTQETEDPAQWRVQFLVGQGEDRTQGTASGTDGRQLAVAQLVGEVPQAPSGSRAQAGRGQRDGQRQVAAVVSDMGRRLGSASTRSRPAIRFSRSRDSAAVKTSRGCGETPSKPPGCGGW